ncbi:uncharacterized protein LOC119730009 [Patiria miniata]|uniref:Uncharacterized protein n=1 Tax=Patiria miniata TaxID=46514 RepID=A0A914A4F1_PATMI|nr:uncharacterized protein LOC119730009 [Patiria miniata]
MAYIYSFLAQLALSEAVDCYQCTPSNSGCGDDPFDASNHKDWLKPCTSGQTCLKTFDNDNSVTRSCRNEDKCRDDSTTSYYHNCVNNVCSTEYCCTGDGCNSAPVAISFSVLLTAFMALATWAFRK